MNIVLQIIYTVLVLGALIFIHELGHFLAARAVRIEILEFSLGMGPKLLQKVSKKSGTAYTLRLLPIGGFVSMAGEDEESDSPNSFDKKPVWARMLVTVAGVAMNLLLGFIITVFLVSFMPKLPSHTVAEFSEGAVSCQYGLETGDEIVRINGMKVNSYSDLSAAFTRCYNTDTVDLEVLRDGEKITLAGVKFPTFEAAENLSVIDFDFKVYAEDKNVGTVLKNAFFQTGSFVKTVYGTLFDILTGRVSAQYLSGPVGTSNVIAQAASTGAYTLFYLVALISVNLAVVNILPLPALDGGRILFLLIELIRRKPVSKKIEAAIHFAGIILLFSLMILITFKDIFFPVS